MGASSTHDQATVAGTLGFTTFVLFQVFNLLNVRGRGTTVFARRTATNRALWIAIGVVLVLQVGVTHGEGLR